MSTQSTQSDQHRTVASRRTGAWRIVALREILVKVTDKAFITSTLVSLLLVAAAVGGSVWLQGRATHTKVVVTTDQAAQVARSLEPVAKAKNDQNTVRVDMVGDQATAENLVKTGKDDAYLTRTDAGWQVVVKRGDGSDIRQQVQTVLSQQVMAQTAAKAGTSMADIARQTTVDSRPLLGDSSRANLARAMGLLFGMLFMMSAMTYGMQIAQSVIEEKQSRIVEILVAAIPVRQLLAGKVLGNALMALGQMALVVATGLIGVSFTSMSSMLPAMSGALGWYLLFFLAGFLALACIWAAAGSMCTRNEDLQQTAQPLIWILVGIYMAGFLATGTARVVLSYVPVASTVLMPVRLVEGSAAWWEPVVALLLDLLFAAGTVLVGERIYRQALLRTQGRLGYKEAFRLAR